MRIIHRIGLYADQNDQATLAAIGVSIQTGIVSFRVDETDSRWPAVADLVARLKTIHTFETLFTAMERRSASFLEVGPTWHFGYPQPEDHYLEDVYDLTDYCEQCGTGQTQRGLFRFRTSPTWGNKSILQQNWVFDEYFVTPEAWRQVFEPVGIASKPVLRHRTGQPIDSVVQLDIPARNDVETEGLTFEACPWCGTRKYNWVTKGFSPKPIGHPNSHMFKSRQWFGSGASGNNAVFVSADLYRRITEAKLKGAIFRPCAP